MPRQGKKNTVFPAGKRNIVTVWFFNADYRDLTSVARQEMIPRGTLIRKIVMDEVRGRIAKDKPEQQKLPAA